MYYVGIDGGGTKTTFTIIDEHGFKLDQITSGTTHYVQVGYNGMKDVIIKNFEELILRNEIPRECIGGVFLGIPGYGEVRESKVEIENIIYEIFKDIKYEIGNDVEVGLAGSLAGQNGINIVSGTGSIALGKNVDKVVRCGGWGDFVGDEGSAYWIGKKALEVFSKESDGRFEKGDLYYHIKEVLALEEDFDIIDFVINKIEKDRGKVAKLSVLCSESALKGDTYAKGIFESAGYELSLLVKMIINKLDFKGEVLVSYSGGVFESKELILNPIINNLKDYNIKLIEPILSPSEGACLLAYKIQNSKIEDKFIDNLREDNNLEYVDNFVYSNQN